MAGAAKPAVLVVEDERVVAWDLRELINWGVVHKIHHPGQRREFFRAEADVWNLFRSILNERKRRELDPTLALLERTTRLLPAGPELAAVRERVESLARFFRLVDALSTRLTALDLADLEVLLTALEDETDLPSPAGEP